MNKQDKKNVFTYFYYLTISKEMDIQNNSKDYIEQIKESFFNLLKYVLSKELINRKYNITDSEKITWLDSYEDLKDGNYNLIFKSAKYNHVRNEIDTETMTKHGRRKNPQDGDEEKTHLCIRFFKGNDSFLTIHESNRYGLTLKNIVEYLNEQFKIYKDNLQKKDNYVIKYESMADEDFISVAKKLKTMSLLKLTVSKDYFKDEFMRFAERSDISDEIEISIKPPRGIKKFPENLIKEYYDASQDKSKIKKVIIKGTNEFGQFKVDSEIMRMKRCLTVNKETLTKEVDSKDFFEKAESLIKKLREK